MSSGSGNAFLPVRLTAVGSLGLGGIPAFYTPAGAGTQIADGGLTRRYGPDGTVEWPPRGPPEGDEQ